MWSTRNSLRAATLSTGSGDKTLSYLQAGPGPAAKAEQHSRAFPQRPAKHMRAGALTPTKVTDVKTMLF